MRTEKTSRESRQRTAILEELRRARIHPTAQMLYRMVRRRIPSVSFGTIYRNLGLLRDKGEVLELGFGKEASRYDATVREHTHLVCRRCGRVMDIEEPHCGHFARMARKKFGFEVVHQRVDMYGYCKKCRNKGDTHGRD